ncbi:MAG: hypothetical protein K5922_06740 [Clostridiales bacterium]|nr:hypothetical protein [Clostridiales bacterium]
MDKAAGGEKGFLCSDSFELGENCMMDDTCNKIVNNYVSKNNDGTVTCFDASSFCDGFVTKIECNGMKISF